MFRRTSPLILVAILGLLLTIGVSARASSNPEHVAASTGVDSPVEPGTSGEATSGSVATLGSHERMTRSDNRLMWVLALLVSPLGWRLHHGHRVIDGVGERAIPRQLEKASSPRGPPCGRNARGRSVARPITLLHS